MREYIYIYIYKYSKVWLNSVIFLLITLTTAVIGCGYFSRDYPLDASYTSQLMTIQFCVEVCRGLNKSIVLLSYDNCYCERSRKELVILPQHFCANVSPCPGNPLQNCGRRDIGIFSVFQIGSIQSIRDAKTGRARFNQKYFTECTKTLFKKYIG